MRWSALALLVCLGLLGSGSNAGGDEGLWLLNQPLWERFEEEFGFRPNSEWLQHLQRATLQFGAGATASFVSADGLVLTNHHVARSQIRKLSTTERDILAEGFLARTREEEIRCPDAAVMSLQEILDVTERVEAAGSEVEGLAEAESRRKAEMAAIEKESWKETGLFSQVVKLYGGGMYHLYRSRRFTDIRLVFAPEGGVAHFGGDEDNFEFPRWALDVALLRVYDENGKPFRPEHYLKLSTAGLEEGNPVFVAGHPRRTQRSFTLDHLRFLRDVQYPHSMNRARTREVELLILSRTGGREAALTRSDLLSVQNWRKGLGQKLRALQDPRVFARKLEEERELRNAAAAREDLAQIVTEAWSRIAEAQAIHEELFDPYYLIEGTSLRHAFSGSDLFRIARIIVRRSEETAKPNQERLKEYRDTNLPNIDLMLFTEAPIQDEIEMDKIESHIAFTAEILGGEHPAVVAMLGGLSAAERARELVSETDLGNIETRRRLLQEGGMGARNSRDPMIQLARQLDPHAREVRAWYEDEVVAMETDAYTRLARARFALFGSEVYPDATGTLRLSAGTVAGFDLEGVPVGPFTDLGGLFVRYDQRGPRPPFALPGRWVRARSRLDSSAPMNFTSTNDIIGGSSGSPVVNRSGECVGVIFDGNRYSFVWDVLYEGERGRAVSVDVRAIVETLRTVYEAHELVAEMLGTS